MFALIYQDERFLKTLHLTKRQLSEVPTFVFTQTSSFIFCCPMTHRSRCMRMAWPLHEKKITPVRKVFATKSARGQKEQAIKLST